MILRPIYKTRNCYIQQVRTRVLYYYKTQNCYIQQVRTRVLYYYKTQRDGFYQKILSFIM